MKPISDKLYYELCFAGLTPIENKQTMIQLTGKVYAVEIPGDLNYPNNPYGTFANFLPHGTNIKNIICWIMPSGKTKPVIINPGSWRFLCTSKECSEEEAQQICYYDRHPTHDYILGWCDYSINAENVFFDGYQESLRSLLRSKSLDPVNNNYAILLKNE